MLNSRSQNVMKLKNSNFDKTRKLKLCKNSKTQMVAKLKNSNDEKTKNSNGDKTPRFDKTQNLKR